MIRVLFLSLLLVIAGLVHLLDPFSFINALPFFVPFKLEVIFWTGLLEFALAAGLLIKKTRRATATLTAIYFFILLPVHIYVSWYRIPMFGVSSSFLLWGRTFFQFALIGWAYSIRKL